MAHSPHTDNKDHRVFSSTVGALLAVYVLVRFGIPWLSVLLGLSENPAPVPAFALGIYMACALTGAVVYVSSDERRWRLFLGPAVRLFVFPPPGGSPHRMQMAVLGALPLLVGWTAWQRVMPGAQTPAVIRIQHPTLPGQFGDLENPFAHLAEEERVALEREGTVLYQKNCRPCHGTKADGAGPLARGLRLRPIDFTDPGTIATVVEPYPFWRIKEGAFGLPGIATPWNSAMPAWKDDLDDEDVWKIIMTEYRISGTEPRKPEGEER